MNVNEIFESLSGEIDGFGGQGMPTTFIRLQGCNLPNACSYCDTPQAQWHSDGTELTVDEVMNRVDMPKVIITGGEPLAQLNDVTELTKKLFATCIPTTIETNGSIVVPHDFPYFDSSLEWTHHEERKLRLRIVMDYKLPSSGMEKYMNMDAFELLEARDIIKFVIAEDDDYTRMKELLTDTTWLAQIAISPVLSTANRRRPDAFFMDIDTARTLAQKMLDDPDLHRAHFNLQIHKLLGLR